MLDPRRISSDREISDNPAQHGKQKWREAMIRRTARLDALEDFFLDQAEVEFMDMAAQIKHAQGEISRLHHKIRQLKRGGNQ
jgi:GTP1/Obg family GTP-binding protein